MKNTTKTINTPIDGHLAVNGSINFFDKIKNLCPLKSNVYFNQDVKTITVILDDELSKNDLSHLQAKILNYIGDKMLQDSFNTVKVMW